MPTPDTLIQPAPDAARAPAPAAWRQAFGLSEAGVYYALALLVLALTVATAATGRPSYLDPVNLAVDASDNLMVLSSSGKSATVYALKPGMPNTDVALILPTPATPAAAHPRAPAASGRLHRP